METSWKTYFNVERVLEISSQFNQLMDDWQINGTETKTAFDDFYRRKIKKVYKPRLCSSGLPVTRPKLETEEPVIKIKAAKKDKKKKKKEKKMPPKEIIPAPKRRKEQEEEVTQIVAEPEKIPTIRISREMIRPKATIQSDGLDIYEPILMVTGRPSTQLHYAKLCRFSQKLKDEGRQLPFLLRNIVVEEAEEQ